ncbi:MAG TPA: Lon-like protease helical domain-containing protein, partial [Longimicrobiales bacterium]
MTDMNRLRPDELYAHCDPESLGFRTTAEISPLEGVLGQNEAMDALRFGISIRSPGFNLFVLGLHGSGRHTFVRQALRSRAAEQPTPSDWCYVADFQDARRPRALELPPGRSMDLRDDMEQLTVDLRASVPRALESEDVATRRTAIAEEHARVASNVVERFRGEIEADGLVALAGNTDSMMIVPAQDGEPLTR